MKPLEEIKEACLKCRVFPMDVRKCPLTSCYLYPYRGGRRIKPWPERYHPDTFSERKAIKMYREAMK